MVGDKVKKANEEFRASLEKVQLPILVLDKKWHQLFQMIGKNEAIVTTEEQVNHFLREQGRLNQEIKELKKVKSGLMEQIVANMDQLDGVEPRDGMSKVIDDNHRLIEEVNQKIEESSDQLLEVPVLLK